MCIHMFKLFHDPWTKKTRLLNTHRIRCDIDFASVSLDKDALIGYLTVFSIDICFPDWKWEVEKSEDDSEPSHLEWSFPQPATFECDHITTNQKSAIQVQGSVKKSNRKKSVEKSVEKSKKEKSSKGSVSLRAVLFHAANHRRGRKRESLVRCLPDALWAKVILPGLYFSFY